MAIAWSWLLPAIILLWSPPFLWGAVRRRLNKWSWRQPASVSGLIAFLPNWLDLLRGAGGTYMLMEFAIKADAAVPGAGIKVVLIKGATVGAGILIQTIRRQKGIIFLAPVFYLTGVTLAFPGVSEWGISIFAIFVGWLFGTAGKNPVYVLPVMGVALGIAGYVMQALNPLLMLNCVLIFCPPIIALLFRKRLIFLGRESHAH